MTGQTKSRTAFGTRFLGALILLVFAGALLSFALGPGWLYPRDVSLRQLQEHPSVYVGQKVDAIGYLVKHSGPHFGDSYTLCEGDPRNLYFAINPCIAVAGSSSTIDRYVSLVYDGTKYDVVLSPCSFAVPCRVIVSGVFTDRGSVVDAAQYVIEASSVAWHE